MRADAGAGGVEHGKIGVADLDRTATGGQVQQQHEPGRALDQGADRGAAAGADDQITFRKTVGGPGGSGVAEVALRCGR
jgi:hypothetical protein